MHHEATLIYSEPIVRHAVFMYWRRLIGTGFFAALTIVALSLVALLLQDAASWIVGAASTVLVFALVLSASIYFVHYRNALHKIRSMGISHATFRADETSFTFGSSIGTATLQWSAVKELWRFPGVWLLLYSKSQFNILPLSCLSPDMQTFVRHQIEAAGGRVDE